MLKDNDNYSYESFMQQNCFKNSNDKEIGYEPAKVSVFDFKKISLGKSPNEEEKDLNILKNSTSVPKVFVRKRIPRQNT